MSSRKMYGQIIESVDDLAVGDVIQIYCDFIGNSADNRCVSWRKLEFLGLIGNGVYHFIDIKSKIRHCYLEFDMFEFAEAGKIKTLDGSVIRKGTGHLRVRRRMG